MGEFFVKAPDKAFFISSCSICLLPSSITSIHLYGFTPISLVVKALVDFCGTTIVLDILYSASICEPVCLQFYSIIPSSIIFIKQNSPIMFYSFC